MANKIITVIPATKSMFATPYQHTSQRKRVAAYARVSTDSEEQENSFDAQVRYYTDKIQSNPEWDFVGVYADEGISGTSIKRRDDFNRMIGDALDGRIDLILTKSVSRFARNTVDSLTTVRKLKEKGVEVYFEKENIYTLDSKGELLITIMSSLAQEESRSISENTAWGRRRQFAEGKYSLSYKNFLGYDKGPEGGLVINESQAETVRRIYREFLSGRSVYTIAKGLTTDGIKTPAGKEKWRSSTVQSILTNEKYYGAALLQKTVKPDILSQQKKNTGELPCYYILDDHEPIVSEEIFILVGEEMRRRKESNTKVHSNSVFSGRIVCGDCGGYYGRKVWHAGSAHPAFRWRCNNQCDKKTRCQTPTVTEEDLETAFIQMFNGLFGRRDEIEENWRTCLDGITDTSEYARELEKAQKTCNELQALMINALKEMSQSDEASEASLRYEDYQTRLMAESAIMEELETKISALKSKRFMVDQVLRTLTERDGPMTAFEPLAWQAVVHHATISADRTIVFTLRDGTEEKGTIKSSIQVIRQKSSLAGQMK